MIYINTNRALHGGSAVVPPSVVLAARAARRHRRVVDRDVGEFYYADFYGWNSVGSIVTSVCYDTKAFY